MPPALSPQAKHGVGAVDLPVGFGGVTFTPGDHLHADEDGVVLLPPGDR